MKERRVCGVVYAIMWVVGYHRATLFMHWPVLRAPHPHAIRGRSFSLPFPFYLRTIFYIYISLHSLFSLSINFFYCKKIITFHSNQSHQYNRLHHKKKNYGLAWNLNILASSYIFKIIYLLPKCINTTTK